MDQEVAKDRQTPPTRKEQIDKLLLMIGGLEESIRNAIEQDDMMFTRTLQKLKKDYYSRLRRVAYGLPEETSLPAED